MSPPIIRNKVVEGDGDPRHGKASTYKNHGCRCTECQAGNTAFQFEFMEHHPEQREKARQRQRLRNRVVARNGTRAKPSTTQEQMT